MKLNLGCGADIKPGYLNVDLREAEGVTKVDLSKIPWPWEDASADEILMLDFLEHFPYRKTKAVLFEVWRVLKPGAFVDIQVPDFEHCARAMMRLGPYDCNNCGWEFDDEDYSMACPKCKTPKSDIADAAMMRLYGGQDYEGNWHFTAFTKRTLTDLLTKNGFGNFEFLEKDHQHKNWNFKVRAFKKDDWGDDG